MEEKENLGEKGLGRRLGGGRECSLDILYQRNKLKTDKQQNHFLVVVAYALKPRIHEAVAGGSLWVWGQLGQLSEFQDIQGYYTEKSYLKIWENKTKQN